MKAFLAVGVALALGSPAVGQEAPFTAEAFADVIATADSLAPVETLLISHRGETVVAEGFHGTAVSDPHNIKSASKTVISALVGIAISRGVLEGVDQPIAPLLAGALPDDPDPRLDDITIGNLLSMQAGLTRTSNEYYAEWIASSNWVEFALAQPFADDPGAAMQYSTGSTHLLSAILTAETGQSTLSLAEDWLSPIASFDITGWDRDPQGIYLGGNNMALRPEALLAFGEVYRNGGRTPDGEQVIAQDWIAASWTERTRSRMNGSAYGYGWFIREIGGEPVYFAWGYGGQMLYVVPSVDLSVVITSDETLPSAGNGHLDALAGLLADIIDVVRGAQA